MKYPIFLIVLASAALMVLFEDANAILGQSEAQSQSQAAEWRRTYGAVDGLFDIGSTNLVIQECWAAPPDLWTLEQALEFARKLIPGGENLDLQRTDDRGSKVVYLNPKYDIELSVDQSGRVYQVDVAIASFAGWRC